MMKRRLPFAIAWGIGVLLLAGCAAQPQEGGVQMEKDEQAIRRYFESWMKATTQGNLELARSLIADDAVFLVPGHGQMDKETFAAAATATDPNIDFQLDSSLQEIRVIGDHAWTWTKSDLVMTDKQSGARTRCTGHSLSILERHGDTWLLIRDANTLMPVKEE